MQCVCYMTFGMLVMRTRHAIVHRAVVPVYSGRRQDLEIPRGFRDGNLKQRPVTRERARILKIVPHGKETTIDLPLALVSAKGNDALSRNEI